MEATRSSNWIPAALAALLAAAWSSCGEASSSEGAASSAASTAPPDEREADPAPAPRLQPATQPETEPTTGAPPDPQPAPEPAASAASAAGLSEAAQRGRVVFLERADPKCSVCHRLADAGSEGTMGPDLDVMKPTAERVLRSVQQGIGLMPTQRGILTDQQMADVAVYVAEVAGR